MKKLLLTSAAATLLVAAQANAAQFEISYSIIQVGAYTSTKPLVNGTPDPTGALGPLGSPIHNIPAVAVVGTGTLDTVTGQIVLGPIDIETNVTSGSYGYVGWSQQFNGSFSGNTYNMTSATVLGGSLVCEDVTTSSCTGSTPAPLALRPPQTYPDPSEDEFGDPVPGGPLTLTSLVFSSLATGGTGEYRFEDDVAPAYLDTVINFTIGNEISEVPVPAAAWLFGSGLLGLAGIGRKRAAK